MISAEQNALMTRIGPGSPAGNLLRNYWQPVALVDELEVGRPVKPVQLLGQDFVIFKDERRRYGDGSAHGPSLWAAKSNPGP